MNFICERCCASESFPDSGLSLDLIVFMQKFHDRHAKCPFMSSLWSSPTPVGAMTTADGGSFLDDPESEAASDEEHSIVDRSKGLLMIGLSTRWNR